MRDDDGPITVPTLNRPAKLNAPDGDALRARVDLARLLVTRPPLTIAAALAAIHRGMDASIDAGLAIEAGEFARIVPTHDAVDGVAAFLEKRPPRFWGDRPRPAPARSPGFARGTRT